VIDEVIDWLLNDDDRKKLVGRVNLVTCPFTTGVHSPPVPRYQFSLAELFIPLNYQEWSKSPNRLPGERGITSKCDCIRKSVWLRNCLSTHVDGSQNKPNLQFYQPSPAILTLSIYAVFPHFLLLSHVHTLSLPRPCHVTAHFANNSLLLPLASSFLSAFV
jgi:hypothetical protein